MNSLWNDKNAKACGNDPLKLRVYTSRLLGAETSLVLHGGGNTSVKATVKDFFGDSQEVLYIKGSGWDLATIEEAGFAAVQLAVLKRMAQLPRLSDSDMVRQQKAAMLDPNAPAPSVEAILHAIIPYKFVDHSHADAVVAISNTPNGKDRIRDVYGQDVAIVPYVMPGFVLARYVYELTKALDWKTCKGIVLLNHGLFTFADEAKVSYENHIALVTRAENYIKKQKVKIASAKPRALNLTELARVRHAVSLAQKAAVIAHLNTDAKHAGFSNLPNAAAIATRGTLTPDHVIRTKPVPVILKDDTVADVQAFAKDYKAYFDKHTDGKLQCLDPAPRWAVWPGQGTVTFGRSLKETQITADIVEHTIEAIQCAEAMGGWKVLSAKDIFQMEYWELEQAKLAKADKPLSLQGKVALVTGAAGGIGQAAVDALVAQGAHVAALDIRPEITGQFASKNVLGVVCDVTKDEDIAAGIEAAVRRFGGLDILVSNAGVFPPSENIADIKPQTWDTSIALNLTSHQRLLSAAVKYLKFGINPTAIIVGSKNVPAPGPGASAYSAAKAGLTQLARVAALELGKDGIRVNIVHPNQVFDTGIWTREVLEKRARHYNMSVQEYKTNNVLGTEITSQDVARLICIMAGAAFAKTTGAQIPIDGGNERVI